MKSIEEVRKFYQRKLTDGEMFSSKLLSSEQQLIKVPTLKRFKLNDSELYHRLLQSFNREDYSSNTVFTCNIHSGIIKEWLHNCETKTGQINFPVAALLELVFAAATKAVALYGSSVLQTGAIRIDRFESLREVVVREKELVSESLPLVSLFVVVGDSGDVSVLQKFSDGHTILVCACRFVRVAASADQSVASLVRDDSAVCLPLPLSGEMSLSGHVALRNMYHVPPLLLHEVLTALDLGDLSAVQSLTVSRDHLSALWRGQTCRYSLSEAEDAIKKVELYAVTGEVVLCMVLSTASVSVSVSQNNKKTASGTAPSGPPPLEMSSRWVSVVPVSSSTNSESTPPTLHTIIAMKSILCVSLDPCLALNTARLLSARHPLSSVTSAGLRGAVKGSPLGTNKDDAQRVDAVVVVLSARDVCFTTSGEEDDNPSSSFFSSRLSLTEWLSALLSLSHISSKLVLLVIVQDSSSSSSTSATDSDVGSEEALSGSVLSLALEQRHVRFRVATLLMADTLTLSTASASFSSPESNYLLEVISSELSTPSNNNNKKEEEVETRYSPLPLLLASESCVLQRSVRRYSALPRSLPHCSSSASSSEVLPSGAYIITGGLGGLGLLTARLLLARGAQCVVLVSRSGEVGHAGQGLETRLAQVQALALSKGAAVQIVRCDVSVECEVVDMLAAVRVSAGSVKGIVHSAGVIRDGLMSASEGCLHSAQEVWRAKALGAQHLHAHTLGDSLSMFLVFSSVVAAVGNAGQVAYAAANRSIEGLVGQRRQSGLCGAAIRWPPVAEVGMAAAAALCLGGGDKSHLKAFEVDAVYVEDLLGRVIRISIEEKEEGQPVVWTIIPPGMAPHIASLPTARQFEEALTAVSSEIENEPRLTITTRASVPVSTSSSQLTVEQVSALVRSSVRALTDSCCEEEVRDDAHLMAEGLDSLGVTELSLRVGAALGLSLSPTMVFSHPTTEAIIRHVCQLMGIDDKSTGVGSAVPSVVSSPPTALSLPSVLEDVAIIGTALRLPGACESLADLWALLVSRESTSIETPKDRWNVQTALSAQTCDDPAVRDRLRYAHFLSSAQIAGEGFRPLDFRLTFNEARAMHPCQKLLLHSVHRALQDAGYSTCASSGEDAVRMPSVPLNTGVFVGAGGFHGSMGIPLSPSHEKDGCVNAGHLGLSAYSATSSSLSVCAGRVSFSLGLTGPCMAIDTACSSSLVALHQARRSLQLGECDLAVVAGVNVLDLESSLAIAVAGMTSSEGRCRSFDETACGYGRGEGCGVVVLKRLSEADRAGDGVYAVVRGSAVAQDGRSASLTAPNGLAQEALLRTALRDARLTPADISLLEAHGTGTRLGDPIETAALNAVFAQKGDDRALSRPLCVSAVKASVGHLEAAAGMAGLFSAILSLQHRHAPPNAQLSLLNPKVRDSVDLTRISFPVTSTLLTPRTEGVPLSAGVSSFGYSGTIAHVILTEAPRTHPFFVSGVERRLTLVEEKEGVCTSHTNTPSDQMTDEDTSEEDEGENENEEEEEEDAEGLVWQFSGQGGLRVNAGRDIFDSEEAFRGAMLTQCDPILLTHCGLTASELLYPDLTHKHSTQEADRLLQMTRFGQPVLVALQVCLAEFWRAQGVAPRLVLGHSLGEFSAAIVSGVLSLSDGLRLVCARGRLVQDCPQCGGVMLAVKASEAQVLTALRASPVALVSLDVAALAAVNGPKSCVVSGSPTACADLLQRLPGAANVRLGVVHAFHSPLLQGVVQPFADVVRSVKMCSPRVTFVSTGRGQVVDEELTTSQYWIDHLLQPVRYSQAVETAYALGGRTFVELGPQNTLTKLTKNILVALGGKEALAECELVACIEEE